MMELTRKRRTMIQRTWDTLVDGTVALGMIVGTVALVAGVLLFTTPLGWIAGTILLLWAFGVIP